MGICRGGPLCPPSSIEGAGRTQGSAPTTKGKNAPQAGPLNSGALRAPPYPPPEYWWREKRRDLSRSSFPLTLPSPKGRGGKSGNRTITDSRREYRWENISGRRGGGR